jgi:hypothetical protein
MQDIGVAGGHEQQRNQAEKTHVTLLWEHVNIAVNGCGINGVELQVAGGIESCKLQL